MRLRSPNLPEETAAAGTRDRFDKWSRMLLVTNVVVLVASALAIATVHTETLIAIAAVALFGGAFAIWVGLPFTSWATTLRSPIGIGLALLTYTLIQCLPIPAGALALLAPANADVWSRSLLPFGHAGPSSASLSLDPGATLVEAIKLVTYLCVFASAVVLAQRRGAVWGLTAVFATGLIVALVTMGHGLLGATKVFGWYQPKAYVPAWHLGPFINPNNLAGYLNLAAMCGVGLLLARRQTWSRWLIGLGIALVVAVEVLAASRGGVLALPIGLLSLAFVLPRRGSRAGRAREPGFVSVMFIVVAALGGGAFLALLGGTQSAWTELYSNNLLKLRMLSWERPLIADFPLFGVGRGAFESVFPAYRPEPGHAVYTHAENFPGQWAAEWGLPIAIGAIAALAWQFRPKNMGVRRSKLAACGLVGIWIVLFQNLFDLGLELPSICIALAVVAGSLWGAALGGGKRRTDYGPPKRRMVSALAVASAGLILIVTTTVAGGVQSVGADREHFFAQYTAWHAEPQQATGESLQRGLRDAMRRHPAEPYFPLLLGQTLWAAREGNPIPAIGRSLERASVNGRAHLLLAEILVAKRAYAQARLELRLATQDDDEQIASAVAPLAVRASQSTAEFLEAIATTAAGQLALTLATDLVAGERRLDLMREIVRRAPQEPSSHRLLAHFYLGELRQGEASVVCRGEQRRTCEGAILEVARTIRPMLPTRSEPEAIEASLLAMNGRAPEAEAMLAERCQNVDDTINCQTTRIGIAAQIRDPDRVRGAIRDLLRVACTEPTQCANTSNTVADLLATRGEFGDALTYYERACREVPTESRWLKVAFTASQIGMHGQAVVAFEKASKLHSGPLDPSTQAALARERDLSMQLQLLR